METHYIPTAEEHKRIQAVTTKCIKIISNELNEDKDTMLYCLSMLTVSFGDVLDVDVLSAIKSYKEATDGVHKRK